MRSRLVARIAAASGIALMVGLTAPAAAEAAGSGHQNHPARLALVTVSNPRPELVSGGEVLVRVDVPSGTPAPAGGIHPHDSQRTRGVRHQPSGNPAGPATPPRA